MSRCEALAAIHQKATGRSRGLGSQVQMVRPRLAEDRRDNHVAGGDAPEQRLRPRGLVDIAGVASDAPRPGDEPSSKDVHVGGKGRRAVTAPQPIDADHIVVDRLDSQATELLGHRGASRAAAPQRLDVLERKAAVPVVLVRPRRKIAGMIFGECDEAQSRGGDRHDLEVHRVPLRGRHYRIEQNPCASTPIATLNLDLKFSSATAAASSTSCSSE